MEDISEDFLRVFNDALDNKCLLHKYNNKYYITYKDGDKIHFFLYGAITYLSKPHPVFKKRLQLKKWFKDIYNELKNDKKAVVHFMGVYHYEGLVVFIEFDAKDYINGKLNSSAAHVYTNDIYQAIKEGYFQRVDKNNNHINVIISRELKNYILGNKKENSAFKFFDDFNHKFPFDEWIPANEAISEMKEAFFPKWRETEWPGFYLEYSIAGFIENSNYTAFVVYLGGSLNEDKLDFDLYFKQDDFYGDLKASDISKYETPGNDGESVLRAILSKGKLWYIIYEHETIKDKDKNNEMAIKRMELIGKGYSLGDKISYAERMKHSVNFKRMKILELNQINMNSVLKVFNQGRQPDGAKRNYKFTIDKKNIDNYIVYSYDAPISQIIINRNTNAAGENDSIFGGL